MRTRRPPRAVLLTCAAVLVLSLAACGQEEPSASGGDGEGTSSAERSQGADDGHGEHSHGGGDSDTPAAYEVQGDLRAGAVEALPGAGGAASGVGGEAWLTQNTDGTTATVELTGLEAGTEYVGHLHAQPCSEDQGGPHFAFDPAGPAEAPNEVHFGFTTDEEGAGEATVHNPRRVGEDARSAVLHDAGSDDRLVCADLEPVEDDAHTVQVEIRDGGVSPSGERIEVEPGQPIRLAVSSDQADTLHVHANPEHEFTVRAGDDQEFVFTLDQPGVYEVESHETGHLIVSVAVTP